MSSPLILQVSIILGHPTYCTECRNKSLRVSHCNCHIREWWSCLLKDKDWNLPIFELDHLLLSIGRQIKIMVHHWVWFNSIRSWQGASLLFLKLCVTMLFIGSVFDSGSRKYFLDKRFKIYELDHLLLSIGRRIKIMVRHWVWFNPISSCQEASVMVLSRLVD